MTKKHSPNTTEAALEQRKRLLVAGMTIAALAFVGLIVYLGALSRSQAAIKIDLAEVETGITEDGFPYQGSPDAPVKFIEYSDYLCGHCRNFALETEPKIVNDYVATGKVQYIYHYYALGEAQILLEEAGHCAADQGHFWPYNKLMFENQGRFRTVESLEDLQALLNEFAQQADLDVAEFETCWNSHQHQQNIVELVLSAFELNINGTPTFSIQGKLIVGNQPYQVFQQAIEASLKEAKK
jgi:protein-disulfide isomerase